MQFLQQQEPIFALRRLLGDNGNLMYEIVLGRSQLDSQLANLQLSALKHLMTDTRPDVHVVS